MTGIKSIIKGLAEKGKITHEETIQGSKFVLRTISSEEQFLVDTMASTSDLKEKYKAEEKINTYMDTISKMRNITLLTFAIESIDGVKPVDEEASAPEQFKQRIEFRDELSTLSPFLIDQILEGYNKLLKKNKEFFKDAEGNLGK